MNMDTSSHQHHPYYHLKWGVFFILLAWFVFTLMATVSRVLTTHVSVTVAIFFQNFISLIFFIPWIFIHGISSLKTKRFGLIFVRSLSGLLGFSCLFLAVQRISLVDAMLLNNTAPLIIPFTVFFWLKKTINHKLWPGIIIGFIGIICILKPGKGFISPGALLAIAAAICLNVGMISVRLLSFTERHHTVLFYYFCIASFFSLPLAIMHWIPLNGVEWLMAISIGILSAVGQWSFMRAFHHAKPTVLGPFCYMSVVYSGLIEWAIWGKVPNLLAWVGILMVCAGGIWTIYFSAPPSNPTDAAKS